MICKDQEKKTSITRRTFLKQTAKAAAALTVAGSLPIFQTVTASASSDRDFDILIKGGTIYDGTLNPSAAGDIGIKNGRIAAVGNLSKAAAGKTIDAGGLVVTPGFIDVHTHCDQAFQIMNPRYLSQASPMMKGNHNYIYQGVTSVVTGNCGMGIPRTDQWFEMVKILSFGTNVAHLAPHGAIRAELFGANQPGELTAVQLDALKQRIAEEMEKGAVGISTGLEYAPGLLASTSELIEIAKVTARYRGLYATHTRDESGKIRDDGKPGIVASLEEAVEVGKSAGIPVEVSHLKIAAPTNRIPASRILDIIEKARREGIEINADQYPYNAGSTYISYLIPNKFKANDGGLKKEFKTEKGRREIREAIETTFSYLHPEKILIAFYWGKAEFEGKTLKDIADMRGKSPAECYVDMVCEQLCPLGIFFSMDMETVNEIMTRDYVITASDGGTYQKGMLKPHPRVYGAFPRKLRMVALDNKIMSLSAAIRSMTSLPAEKFGIKNRGKIERGFFADIAVIDLANFADRATYVQPHQYAVGIRHLLVNGVVAINDGQATSESGGAAIKR
jgi:N-acyl-D-amino-acid deacylase